MKVLRKIIIVLNAFLTVSFAVIAGIYLESGDGKRFGLNIFCSLCWLLCMYMNTKTDEMNS